MSVRATAAEVAAVLPGDDLVPDADVVMDRALLLPAPPEVVWPWLVQLGKSRAGWYLPRRVERVMPAGRRAIRVLDPRWQQLAVGDLIPDWGGRDAHFEAVQVRAPLEIVYASRRARMTMSWVLTLRPVAPAHTRVHIRLRLGPVRRPRLARYGGGLLDWLTIAGLQAGLRERVVRS